MYVCLCSFVNVCENIMTLYRSLLCNFVLECSCLRQITYLFLAVGQKCFISKKCQNKQEKNTHRVAGFITDDVSEHGITVCVTVAL